MNQFSVLSLCGLLSVTLFGASCVMEEEVDTQEKRASEYVISDRFIIDDSDNDTRHEYVGPEQQAAPDRQFPSVEPNERSDENPGIDLDWGVDIADPNPNDPRITQRNYKCDSSKNFVRFVEYERIEFDALSVEGKTTKDMVKHCAKECDQLAGKCATFFYVNTFDNRQYCGLIGELSPNAVPMWIDALDGSQLCYLR